jgi:hypothetical protein
MRIENMRTQNALADAAFGQSLLKANQPSMTGLPGGGLAVMDPRSGSISIVNPGMQGFGTMPGTPATTRQVYPQVKAPAGGGAQVDRATGNTMGGRLPAEAAATTTNASPIVTQPRSATLTDRAINALPFGEAIFDMPRVMTPERTARLEETKRQREAERLKQIKEMQEFQTRDLGPSMF